MTSLVNDQYQSQHSWSQQLNDDAAFSDAANENTDLNDDSVNASATASVRKRTRATADQLSVLEDTFTVNVSPNSKLRKQLAEQLQMSERSIQIWFQNRRAKVKHIQKKTQMQLHQASIRAQLYQYHQQQQQNPQHDHQQQMAHSLLPMQPYQQPYYYGANVNHLAALQRSQSVDAVHHYNNRFHHPVSQQDMGRHLLTPNSSSPSSSVPPTNTTPLPDSYGVTPPPMTYPQFFNQQQLASSAWASDALRLTRQSMPPQMYTHDSVNPSSLEVPRYVHGSLQQTESSVPTLVHVPDAGPTAILSTNASPSHHSVSPDVARTRLSSNGIPTVSTIDPSNLMINSSEDKKENDNKSDKTKNEDMVTLDSDKEQVKRSSSLSEKENDDVENSLKSNDDNNNQSNELKQEKNETLQNNDEEQPNDLYISATTLTIGTWHRLKMQETDLVCVYRPDTRIFAWHIVDGGCHFKMEVPQHAVSSIECIMDNHEPLLDVHFDISEPPLFYMESTTSTVNNTSDNKNKKKSNQSNNNESEEAETQTETVSPIWVQCSDFTEGKQASRFFRHTLKGVTYMMKQELLTLINNHEETRRLVHFVDTNLYNPMPMYQPLVGSQRMPYISPVQNMVAYNQFRPHLKSNTMNDEHLLLQSNAFINQNTAMYWPNQNMGEPVSCETYIA